MPSTRGTPKRTRSVSQREADKSTEVDVEHQEEEVKAPVSPQKRTRRGVSSHLKSPERHEEVEETMQSPRGKRRKVEEETKPTVHTPRRRTRSMVEQQPVEEMPPPEATTSDAGSERIGSDSGEVEKNAKGRSRKVSFMAEVETPGSPSTGRSVRNRQPSRRMMESKMDEALLQEALGSARRGSRAPTVIKQEVEEEGEETVEVEQIADEQPPPEEPPSDVHILMTESPQAQEYKQVQEQRIQVQAALAEPSVEEKQTPKRGGKRQKAGADGDGPHLGPPPRTVVFKTISTPQAPEGERKRTVSSSSNQGSPLKPILTVKDGAKVLSMPPLLRPPGSKAPEKLEMKTEAVHNQPSKPLHLAQHIRSGWDLPEEHRPKGAARPVVLTPAPGDVTPAHEKAQYYPPASEDQKPPREMVHHQEEEQQIHVDESGEAYEVIDESGQQMVYEEVVHDDIEYAELPPDTEVVIDPTDEEMDEDDPAVEVDIEDAPEMDIAGIKQEAPHGEEDDDAPPQLVPELGPTSTDQGRRQEVYMEGESGLIRVQSPGGTSQFVQLARGEDGTEIYVDENGEEVHMVEDNPEDLRTVEFNFLDSKNICCGLCGEIVPYETLMSHHLPNHHPDVLGDGGMNLEEVPYENWLRDKLYNEKKNMEGGFRYDGGMTNEEMMNLRMRGARPLRKVSQIRVNPVEMTLPQLELALKKKMIEKMGRKVPVALVDKQHARCGICSAVVSLNKKFEIVHLVRHFNAWHPSAHRCAGTWQNRPVQPASGKPLSIQDFAVIDVNMESSDNLQCIWCGMFMDRNALAMHFTEVHPDEIEVPKCLLCLQELVINARLLEKYGEDFEVVLPDEFHVKCHKFEQTYSTEAALDRAIAKRVQKMQASGSAGDNANGGNDDDDEEETEDRDTNVTNSRMNFGRRHKPKRSFVQPSLRQAVPANSKYVEAVTECQWKCKLCGGNIFGAVISAGAIKHYKQYHPGEMESMQYELCKARLERVSDGCMEFVHPQLVECLICNLTYALHKPYNMCRGIRHLKIKHPEMMPEFAGGQKKQFREGGKRGDIRMGEVIDDPEMLARFKNEYNVDFEKVQTLYGADGEPVYVLLGENETLDSDTAKELAKSLEDGDGPTREKKPPVVATPQVADAGFDEEDPYGELAEDDEMADIEAKAAEQRRRPRVVRGAVAQQPAEEEEEDTSFLEMAPSGSRPKGHVLDGGEAAMDEEAVYHEEEEEGVEQQYEYYDENNERVYLDEDGQIEEYIDVYEEPVEEQ